MPKTTKNRVCRLLAALVAVLALAGCSGGGVGEDDYVGDAPPGWASVPQLSGSAGATDAVLTFIVKETSTVYWEATPAGSPVPDPSTLRILAIAGGRTISAQAGVRRYLTLTGLTADTAHDIHLVPADTGGTLQAVPWTCTLATAPVSGWPLVFANSDFEADVTGLTDPAFGYSTNTPWGGSRAVVFVTNYPPITNGDPVTARTYSLSGSANMNNNSGRRYLTFYFRGTVSGVNPGLRFQVGSGGSYANYFDLNSIIPGTTTTLTPNTGGNYPVTAINVPEWTKVRLDLSTVNWAPSGAITAYPLRFRTRQQITGMPATRHDWMIDEVRFEN